AAAPGAAAPGAAAPDVYADPESSQSGVNNNSPQVKQTPGTDVEEEKREPTKKELREERKRKLLESIFGE
ncbi:MAG: hypothetical protein HKN85_09240, partial [Gammaproteobacteria bacterium]|nr:hypothetical protein [Gammaproteobacteria bacterium]